MSGFWLGLIVGLGVCIVAYGIDTAIVVKRAQKVKIPNEKVESYDATVFTNPRGEISWVNNSSRIKKIRNTEEK